jgi:hypothetical protein
MRYDDVEVVEIKSTLRILAFNGAGDHLGPEKIGAGDDLVDRDDNRIRRIGMKCSIEFLDNYI